MKYKKILIKDYSFFYITDDKGLIYCEPVKHGNNEYRITSVHKPDTKVGTGYLLVEYAKLDKKTIDNALNVFMPSWADKADIKHIQKYETLDKFINYQKQFYGEDIRIEDIEIN